MSIALDHAPLATIYIPLADAVFCFQTNILSPTLVTYPSIVNAPLNALSAVVAAIQGSL
jgi:hypothetical protein